MEESNPLEEPPDMEGEQLVNLVNKAVAAITTRVQSKLFTFSVVLSSPTLPQSHSFNKLLWLNIKMLIP